MKHSVTSLAGRRLNDDEVTQIILASLESQVPIHVQSLQNDAFYHAAFSPYLEAAA